MQKEVEHDWKLLPWRQVMVVQGLPGDPDLSLFLEILTLDGDGQVIAVTLFDLNNDTDGHSFLSKGHFDYFVEHRTAKADFFY